MNTGVQTPVEARAFSSRGDPLRIGAAESYGHSSFRFWGTPVLSSMPAASLAPQPAMLKGWDFSTSSPIPVMFCFFFGFGVFSLKVAVLMGIGWYLVVLICLSVTISDTEHLFMWLWGHSYICGERSVHDLRPFWGWVVLCAFVVASSRFLDSK